MFDYTKAAFNTIVDDFKLIDFLFKIVFQFLYIAYLIYAIVVGAGFLWVNIAMFVLVVMYLPFEIYTRVRIAQIKGNDEKKGVLYKIPICKGIINFLEKRKAKKQIKQLKKSRKDLKKRIRFLKLFINTISLIFILYGAYTMSTHITPVSVIFYVFVILSWIIQVVIALATQYVEKRLDLLWVGIKSDVSEIIQPVSTVTHAIKKVIGKESESQPVSRAKAFLQKKIEKDK